MNKKYQMKFSILTNKYLIEQKNLFKYDLIDKQNVFGTKIEKKICTFYTHIFKINKQKKEEKKLKK